VRDGEASRRPPDSRTSEDAELVARCRAGDQAAWGALVERFGRYVYAIAVRGFGLTNEQAEDVFQEVFARTFEHLDSLRDDGAIRPFVGQLTRRLAIDQLRAAARAGPLPEADVEAPSHANELEAIEQALDVRDALAALSDECREVLDRFFARDESYRTISQELGIAPGTVASRISRCLSRLAEELEGRNPPPDPSSAREDARSTTHL
jgi:RNA polymerase sigma factor (sigma-70 family)